MAMLEKYQMYIGGEWRASGDGKTRPVLNPATGEPFAEVPEGTREDARAALLAAQAAQPAWAALTGVQRAGHLKRLAELIRESSERLARLVVQEQGKPLVEARGEIGGSAGFIEYPTAFARDMVGEIIASDNPNEDIWVRRVPFGVVVGIIPWNYPSALFARKVGPALMAGNAIVIKPHEDTPLSSIELARLCEQAGIPAGVVNVVTGAGLVVGEALVRDPITQLVTVTGSVRAGKQILAAAAENITVVSLELGGKAPFIVMDDADVELAARNAIQARRERADDGITPAMVRGLVDRVEDLRSAQGRREDDAPLPPCGRELRRGRVDEDRDDGGAGRARPRGEEARILRRGEDDVGAALSEEPLELASRRGIGGGPAGPPELALDRDAAEGLGDRRGRGRVDEDRRRLPRRRAPLETRAATDDEELVPAGEGRPGREERPEHEQCEPALHVDPPSFREPWPGET